MLNYKYRLYPTEAQRDALLASMRMMRWGWNLTVRRERRARRAMREGRAANVHAALAEAAAAKKPVGARVAKLRRLQGELNVPAEKALAILNAADVRKAWERTGSGLSVAHALAVANQSKQEMVQGLLGRAWAQMQETYADAWVACWRGVKGAPRKNMDRFSGWLCAGTGGRNPIASEAPNEHGDALIDLGVLMPGPKDRLVRFCWHRPLPPSPIVRELKIIRRRDDWWVVYGADLLTGGCRGRAA